MRITQALLVGWLAVVSGCEVAPPGADAPRAGAQVASHKPSAPVRLALTSHAAPGGAVWLVLAATPTQALSALELTVGDAAVGLGAVAAGETRRLTWRAPDAAAAHAAVARAVTVVGLARRSAVATLANAASSSPESARGALRTRILPGGVAVAEAR